MIHGLVFSAFIVIVMMDIAGMSIGGFAVGSYFIWIQAPIWAAPLSYPMIAVITWLSFLALFATVCCASQEMGVIEPPGASALPGG